MAPCIYLFRGLLSYFFLKEIKFYLEIKFYFPKGNRLNNFRFLTHRVVFQDGHLQSLS